MARWDAAWHRRLREILATLPDRTPEEATQIRRGLAENDVIAFAIIYMGKHLRGRETGDRVTFAECHYEWARMAESWGDSTPVSEPMAHRDAFIAPRSCGKTTWWFLVIPLWAAAFNRVRFCAAFSQAAGQAEGHLQTMRSEMDANPLLRFDFPSLCAPARRQSSGTTVADRQGMIHTASGFTFAARGLDSAVLGLKVGEVRPSVLIVDDAEPDESQYSPLLAGKRLRTLTDAIFALNIYARVVMVGTVTMPQSIAHQMVRYAAGDIDESNEWVREEKINVHHHRAILINEDGSERSIWPAKWPLRWLVERRHTREFQKNYDNDPRAVDGGFWVAGDFQYGTLGDRATRWIIQLDPAVTTRGTSDWTGISVVGYAPPVRPGEIGMCEVAYAAQVRLAGDKLRAEVIRILSRFQRVRAIRAEVNQGGSLWDTIFQDLPRGVKLLTHTSSSSKEVRFSEALKYYQEGRVFHRERLVIAEDQMMAYPRTQFDDVADAVAHGVLFFLGAQQTVRVSARTAAYT